MSNAHIDHMEAAVRSLKAQFSVVHSTQEDNVEVLQEFAEAMMTELSNLVHLAGGNASFLMPVVEGIRNDIDLCFFEENPVQADVFKPRPGLLKLIVLGADMRGSR